MYCSICLTSNSRLPTKMYCNNGHVFHVGCMDDWKMFNSNCPECREELIFTTTYNLRSRKIDKSIWENIRNNPKRFTEYSDLLTYVRLFAKKFDQSLTTKNKLVLIYDLFHVFINNHSILVNNECIFDIIRRVLLSNLLASVTIFTEDCEEKKEVNYMLDILHELNLDY